MSVRQITYADAIVEALREEMRRDRSVILLGEDVWYGVFVRTRSLFEEFGPERVIDCPISESGFVGAALGAAITGLRPVVEIMISDFALCAMDSIANEVAKYRYYHGGAFRVPVVIRLSAHGSLGGTGGGVGAMDSQSLEATFMHFPGLKIVMPSTPYDAKGLLKTAIRDDNPALFFEHKMLYRMKGPVPAEDYTIPFGVAKVRREGEDVTLVTYSMMVHRVLSAAEELEKQEISVEVVDLRTLVPLDSKTILDSIKKTGRLVIVEEDCKRCGVGAEIAAIAVDEGFDYLDAPIKRVATPDIPIPSLELEKYVIPDVENIINIVKQIF